MKQELLAVNYRDGMILAFTDGEVVEMMHKGFNRMGREWMSNTLAPVGAYPLGNITADYILNEKYECIVFDDAAAYQEKLKIITNDKLKSDGMDIVDTINDINLEMNGDFSALDKQDMSEESYDFIWNNIKALRARLAEEESKLEVINNNIDWEL